MDLGIPGLGPAEELGRSPAATTYRSANTAGRAVVLKVLAREATPEVWARFDYDHQRLNELANHPNVVAVLGHGRTPTNHPFVVLDDVPGGSFAAKVGAGLDGVGVLSLGIRVAGALESCHRRDVVHGDLRPEDILVDEQGEPEVADFGLVLSTGFGPERSTTPARIAHAAPEQLGGLPPTPATDVYALGSILYALLAGAPAFVSPGETSVAHVGSRIRTEAPAPLEAIGVPGPVAAVVQRALAKDPAARWSSAEAMGIALQQAQVTLGQPLTPMVVTGHDRVVPRPVVDDHDVAPQAAASSGTSNTRLLLVAVAVAVVAVLVVFFVVGGGDDGEAPPDRSPIPPTEAVDLGLREVTDDGGIITVQAPEFWGEDDGAALGAFNDLVVSDGDPIAFTNPDGLSISGIEVTTAARDDIEATGVEPDADGLRADRVLTRNLAEDCSTDLPPEQRTIAGFAGTTQRFEDCVGAQAIVVFGGIDGDFGLVLEFHLVNDDDEEAFDAVVDGIEIDR